MVTFQHASKPQADGSVTTISEALPKVSIIINNYNYGHFLAAALNSALLQTYPNCETIVVDDGSTDNSHEVLAKYRDRVSVLAKANGGQSSALNLGFANSTGRLVAFLDSDDELFPDAIQAAVDSWSEEDVKVQFPMEVLGPDGQATGLLMPRNPLSSGNVLTRYLRTGRYVTSPTSGNLFSRKFLDQIFPIPEKEWAQTADGYINTCAPFFGTIKALRRPLAFYRVHGRSMSSISDGKQIDLKQIEKLISHAMLEKGLLQKMADQRGHSASSGAVVGHWMHLKLRIAFYKLADFSWLSRCRLLVSSAYNMVASVACASELSFIRKLQNIGWALVVLVSPKAGARRLIAYAFNPSPASPLLRRLRRT